MFLIFIIIVSYFEKEHEGLERWLSNQERLLLFQRTEFDP